MAMTMKQAQGEENVCQKVLDFPILYTFLPHQGTEKIRYSLLNRKSNCQGNKSIFFFQFRQNVMNIVTGHVKARLISAMTCQSMINVGHIYQCKLSKLSHENTKWDGDLPLAAPYGINISPLYRFVRICFQVFNCN